LIGTAIPTETVDVVYTSTVDVDATVVVSQVETDTISLTSTSVIDIQPPTVTVTTTFVSSDFVPALVAIPTLAPKKKRHNPPAPVSGLPWYAQVCGSPSKYISACSCVGVTGASSIVAASPSLVVLTETVSATTTPSTVIVYETVSVVTDYETVSTVYTTAVYSTVEVSVLASVEIDTTIEPTATVTATVSTISYGPNPTFSIIMNYPAGSNQLPQPLSEIASAGYVYDYMTQTNPVGDLFTLDIRTGLLSDTSGPQPGYYAGYINNQQATQQYFYFIQPGAQVSDGAPMVCSIIGVSLTCNSNLGPVHFFAGGNGLPFYVSGGTVYPELLINFSGAPQTVQSYSFYEVTFTVVFV
jgi:hypothetical protein